MVQNGSATWKSTGIGIDDGALDRAIRESYKPVLAVSLVHLTGDTGLIDRCLPRYVPFQADAGALDDAFLADLHRAAKRAIREYLDGKPLAPPPDSARLKRMIDFVAGKTIPDSYLPYALDELKMDGRDPRRPDWAPELAPAAAAMKVVVIGAGMSGLLAGIRLGQAGIPHEIVEKSPDVGGVWFENTYPGVRVDSPNHGYAYSFIAGHRWPDWFSRGEVLHDYFRKVADDFGLRDRIRFNTEVTAARWDEGAGHWHLTLRQPDGSQRQETATAIISAVGQLNQPKIPDIPGLDSFTGVTMHSARWDHGVDLAGKRVAVVGTGASGYQIVPELAPLAERLHIFQSSPVWISPQPEYQLPVGEGFQWLLHNLPFYERWFRFRMFWQSTEGSYAAMLGDPDWNDGGRSISQANKQLSDLLAARMRAQLTGAEYLIDKVIPTFPVGVKRTLRDDGTYFRTLRRENVDLIASGVAAVEDDTVIARDGTRRQVDAIVFATGFHASEFLRTIDVRGRGGRSLKDEWQGDARAYLGLTVPDFPNFFMLYGPNTNLVSNGSKFLFSECGTRYILGCLELLASSGKRSVAVRREVYQRFNEELDALNRNMAWGFQGVSSWYKNPRTGRVSQNWPFPCIEYWTRTRRPDPAEFALD